MTDKQAPASAVPPRGTALWFGPRDGLKPDPRFPIPVTVSHPNGERHHYVSIEQLEHLLSTARKEARAEAFAKGAESMLDGVVAAIRNTPKGTKVYDWDFVARRIEGMRDAIAPLRDALLKEAQQARAQGEKE